MALDATLSAPVFIVGCGRSGTTLLRLMLNAHPDLAIPHESHFMYQLMRLRAHGKWPHRFDESNDWQRLIEYL